MTTNSDGKAKIVDRDDDLIAAIRYCVAMIRHAIKESEFVDYDEEEFEETYQGRNAVSGY
jgi:hypothetical protein